MTAAPALLGWWLVSAIGGARTEGIIVETEAYLPDDPASHPFRGFTRRNAAMFGPPATAYLYLIYGLHYCFNIVTGEEGSGEAVLVRALIPVAGGTTVTRRRRSAESSVNFHLTDGPAKLTATLGLDLKLNGHPLDRPPLELAPRRRPPPVTAIERTPRRGITRAADRPWRFVLTPRERAYQLVAAIPEGKVATYGQVAALAGVGPRSVGRWLHVNPDPQTVPCHRVVGSDGRLAANFAFGGAAGQCRRPEREGILLTKDRVNLAVHRWVVD